MIKNVNRKNIEEKMEEITFSIKWGHEDLSLILACQGHKITYSDDDSNFEGTVEFEIDTEFGGGPAYAETSFIVKEGQLRVDLDVLDYDSLLDKDDIKSNMDDYSDQEDTAEFELDDDDSYDTGEIDGDW